MRPRLEPLFPLVLSLPFWAAMLLLVRATPPQGWGVRLVFLLLLTASLSLTLTPAFFLVPQPITRGGTLSQSWVPAARRATIGAVAVSVMVWLRMERILDPLNGLLLVVAAVLIEFVILQRG